MSDNPNVISGKISREEQIKFQEEVRKNFRYNIFPIVGFEFFWGLGLPFGLLTVLIPSYLNFLSSPKWLIGIVSSIFVMLTPLQLLGDRILGGVGRKKRVWFTYFISTFSYIGYAIFCMFVPITYKYLHIGIFIIAVVIFFSLVFLATPVYLNILTDNSPLKRRGKLLGYRTAGLGIGGLMNTYPAKVFYQHFKPPESFYYAMLISGILFAISTLNVLFIKDNIDPEKVKERISKTRLSVTREIYILLRKLWNTPNYKIFIFFVILITSAGSIAPFIVTYAQDAFSPEGNVMRIFNLCFLISALVAGTIIGYFGDRWGYKTSIIIQAGLVLTGFALVVSIKSIYATYLAYIFYCCMSIPFGAALCNMSVELLPKANPAKLWAAGNIFILPTGFSVPTIVGRVIDIYKAQGHPEMGYTVAFVVAIVLAIVGMLGFIFLVQEPRTGKAYIIKIFRRT